jgi:DNA-directed RNA polymerase subunit RPC12/RpoP
MRNKPQEDSYHCHVCGRKISKADHEAHDGLCWECWDDQLTEESLDMFGEFM